MRLHVLGTAAGGGLPQWNCACPGCSGARVHPGWRRRHASLAVEVGDGRCFVVNATPDIADQVEQTAALHPGPGPRRTPLAGVVLTDAELDHTLGLARLREAEGLEVVATSAVREALTRGLCLDRTLAPYTRLTWRELTPHGGLTLGGAIEVAAVPVSGKRPRYAADLDSEADGWVAALRLTDRETGGVCVYAPAMGVWPDGLDGADCVIVDGTFWDEEEPRRTGVSSRTATEMGHLSIEATMERLAALPGRALYTHLNNTNPLADPGAPHHKVLDEVGVEVAADGMVIEL
ncbi:pyrroloquinoline quinone biosynthesis protein PqqB [Nonomuraea africana]|uniref:Coenzyme PQQ synthesis protein B n=1 Tax=Nonomuraea africana TaxID=46171 RepID=A0ABR9KDP2_9ACTN|nr:MBL fold metallo-hydrolase [Nonomuraea africana]MBE1560134.1 pyrroloquinoline quinone biosynthesis protein B [Nonomuraea africana]